MVERLIALTVAFVLSVISMRGTDIRSLLTFVNGECVSQPVLRLASNDRLTVAFDDLCDDRRFFRIKLVHCGYDGAPSEITPVEYTSSGFNEMEIADYSYSHATSVPYVHYSFDFPDKGLNVTKSGRYRIDIFSEENRNNVLETVDLYVVENGASVNAELLPNQSKGNLFMEQQLMVDVDFGETISNSFNDVILVADQNSRKNSEVVVNTPSSAVGRQIRYHHVPQLIFPASKNYRRFETVTLYKENAGVKSMDLSGDYFNAILNVDYVRNRESDFAVHTLYGGYVVRNAESETDSDISADYVMTHFTLNAETISPDIPVFIEGDLTRRRFDDDSKMNYNPSTRCFEKQLLLKQGSYNYNYIAEGNGADKFVVEGCDKATKNRYNIKIYLRNPLNRTCRLVGFNSVVL